MASPSALNVPGGRNRINVFDKIDRFRDMRKFLYPLKENWIKNSAVETLKAYQNIITEPPKVSSIYSEITRAGFLSGKKTHIVVIKLRMGKLQRKKHGKCGDKRKADLWMV
jgi:hypothetical protein